MRAFRLIATLPFISFLVTAMVLYALAFAVDLVVGGSAAAFYRARSWRVRSARPASRYATSR